MQDNTMIPEIIIKDTVVFSERIALGTLEKGSIDEASGMAMSMVNGPTFWTHNDSGDKARIFLVDTLAQYQMTINISNASNRDWEDVAVARDLKDGQSKIYIADIGDNDAKYEYYTIYILPEPIVTENVDVTIDYQQKIVFKYQDGSRDAETLMVDPLSGNIYIVSKREANVQLYQITYPYSTTDTVIAKKMITLPFTQIVAGDISADGKNILLKNYQKVWYWSRKDGTSIVDALSKNPYETPYIQEPQGESICWSPDSKAFYTISEESPIKIKPILYKYIKLK